MKDSITSIKELRYGMRVTVNDTEILCLRYKDCKKQDIREGDAIDLQKLKEEILLQQYPDALNRAVRLLAVRARSSFEIEKRLTDACFMVDTVEMVLTKLKTNGLLDDSEFAKQWARERTARQMGKARILYELRQKGVEAAVAEEALAQLDDVRQEESALKLAEKLRKRYQSNTTEDARRKTIQAMQRRGYSYGDALRALEKLKEDVD